MLPEQYWIAIMNIQNDFYVLASSEGGFVNRFDSREKALKFFTDSYILAYSAGFEGVNFALDIYTTLQPKVVGVTLDTITQQLFDEGKGVFSLRLNEALGALRVLKCNRPSEVVKKIYDSGEMPEFMTPAIKNFIN